MFCDSRTSKWRSKYIDSWCDSSAEHSITFRTPLAPSHTEGATKLSAWSTRGGLFLERRDTQVRTALHDSRREMDSSNVAKLDPNSLKVDVLHDLIFGNSKSTLVFYSGGRSSVWESVSLTKRTPRILDRYNLYITCVYYTYIHTYFHKNPANLG